MMKKLIIRTYKFRLYPSKQIVKKMEKVLSSCKFLYNTELEYEKQIYFSNRQHANKKDLNNLIPDWKIINPDLKNVHSQVLQNVSDRLCKVFESFFGRIKRGEKAGFPRFKSEKSYSSFTFPQNGFKLEENKLRLSKIGVVNVKLHRKIKGRIKTLIIKKTSTCKWFACFSVEKEKKRKQKRKNLVILLVLMLVLTVFILTAKVIS